MRRRMLVKTVAMDAYCKCLAVSRASAVVSCSSSPCVSAAAVPCAHWKAFALCRVRTLFMSAAQLADEVCVDPGVNMDSMDTQCNAFSFKKKSN